MSVNCVISAGEIDVKIGDGDSSEEKLWELGWGLGGTQRRSRAAYRPNGNKACAP